MREPSRFNQHSCGFTIEMGAFPCAAGAGAFSEIGLLSKSSGPKDNSFRNTGFYLDETSPLSLHLGSFGSPFFGARFSGFPQARKLTELI
jgi:hypothetical protein